MRRGRTVPRGRGRPLDRPLTFSIVQVADPFHLIQPPNFFLLEEVSIRSSGDTSRFGPVCLGTHDSSITGAVES